VSFIFPKFFYHEVSKYFIFLDWFESLSHPNGKGFEIYWDN
jgi:hypothetical protein